MGTVTFNFTNATISTSNCVISIGQGGAVDLTTSGPLTVTGTVTVSSLWITTNVVNFGVAAGSSFTAAVVVPLTATSGETPEVTVTGFEVAGTVTAMWPTANGLVTEALTPNNMLPLAGYTG